MFWNKSNKRKIVIELDDKNYPAGILIFDKNQLTNLFSNFNQKLLIKSNNENKKDKFVEYLIGVAIKNNKQEHYAISTANSYKSAINTVSEDFLFLNLWDISDSKEIKRHIDSLSKNSNYLKKNDGTNNTLSNGLERYKEFTEYNEKNNIQY